MRTIRDLMLQVDEVAVTEKPFAVTRKMMDALDAGQITQKEFDLLSGTLYMVCKKNNIETSSEFLIFE